MKVLIAEDDRITRLQLVKFLEDWGYQALAVANGNEAWQAFQKEPCHLLITDWEMPGINGLTLVKKIREIPEITCYIIMLTSHNETKDVITGIEVGADDFIKKPFRKDELRVRVRAGERIISLENRLIDQNKTLSLANSRMKRDLASASKVQSSLLPSHPPENQTIKFAWAYQPSEELGGDMLNIFMLDENHIGLYLADVSGHGVAASLLSVRIHQAMTPYNKQSSFLFSRHEHSTNESFAITSPAEVASNLEQRFPMDLTGLYFTLVYCIINIKTGMMAYINAGHPPMLWLDQDGQSQLLGCNNPGIGWGLGMAFEERSLQLHNGDRLCLYSDGITEACNETNQQYGPDRLAAFLSSRATDTIADITENIIRDITLWCKPKQPEDDRSMILAAIDSLS